jgi:hypothetical protein
VRPLAALEKIRHGQRVSGLFLLCLGYGIRRGLPVRQRYRAQSQWQKDEILVHRTPR